MKRFATLTRRLTIVGAFWLAGVGRGIWALWDYSNAPGLAAQGPMQWPRQTRVQPPNARPELILAIHPRCPCSRASIGELAVLMTRLQGKLDATVLFYSPSRRDAQANWDKTDLWRDAKQIPGVTVLSDPEGVEAARFGALTSGQSYLYSPQGQLLFEGGITGSRGHYGDNAGVDSIEQFVITGRSSKSTTFVFGCSLVNPERQAKSRTRPS